ncbi:4059_t:CDS:2 [Funneliformis geosporum]|nr:4059_t:CDS:2 [Funneliformis geosporum]
MANGARKKRNIFIVKKHYPGLSIMKRRTPFSIDSKLITLQKAYLVGQDGSRKTIRAIRAFPGRKVVVLTPDPACLGKKALAEILIFDEACMIPKKVLQRLLSYAESRGCQNIMCGDPGQLTPWGDKEEKVAKSVVISEQEPCSKCNEELFLYEIKRPLTILSYGHTYHLNCIERSIKISPSYPKPDCKKEVELAVLKSPGNLIDNDLMDISPSLFNDLTIL